MYCYKAVEQQAYNEYIGTFTAYGITVWQSDQPEDYLLCMADVTTDQVEAENLARLCNEAGLEPVHLADVVENFLNT